MKKLLIIGFAILLSSSINAQKFGHLNSSEIVDLLVKTKGVIEKLEARDKMYSEALLEQQNTFQKEEPRKRNILGILCAFGSVLCAVLAALLSRVILIGSTLSPLQTTEIRLLSASIFLFLIFKKDFFDILNNRALTKKNHSNLILSTLLGTNFGILFQQIVFKFLPIGIGWTLLSLSPVFALFFSKREGDEINELTIFYSLLSFIGVSIALI